MNVAFQRNATYTAHVFVPYLPDDRKTKSLRTIYVQRAPLGESLAGEIVQENVEIVSVDQKVRLDITRVSLSASKVLS